MTYTLDQIEYTFICPKDHKVFNDVLIGKEELNCGARISENRGMSNNSS
jgi:hypothetical protein